MHLILQRSLDVEKSRLYLPCRSMEDGMKLCVISFTRNGRRLAEHIAKALHEVETVLYTKYKGGTDETPGVVSGGMSGAASAFAKTSFVETSLNEWAKVQMEERNALLFIGACGIAVRAIAPYLTDKLHDSPVLVMDERGEYVIPILSGHMGGANELACYLSEKTGAVPVITTATDIYDKFAIDLFAKENDLYIVNKEGIANVSAKVLAGEEITVSIEPGYDDRIPVEMCRVSYPPVQHVDILITSKDDVHDAAILLKPKEFAIGLGCKKGKSAGEIEDFIMRKLQEYGVSTMQIFALSSISIKSEERGIIRWCRKERIPFLTYTAEELQAVEGKIKKSSFVQEHVGVDNVCERAALRACGESGQLICAKYAENGMTFALAKRVRKRQG